MELRHASAKQVNISKRQLFYIVELCFIVPDYCKMWHLTERRLFSEICGALRDLVPYAKFKKRENHPWRSVTFSKLQAEACNFTKNTTPPWGCFSYFLNCTNGTKSSKPPHK